MEFLLTLQLSYFVLLLTSAIWPALHSIRHGEQVHYHQPSTSFTHLIGASKGYNHSGIENVKKYLHRFGYLNDIEYDRQQIMDDQFDDSLENAILTYQNFFKLNKTGVLDRDTILMMSKPRCGNPDIHRLTKTNNFGHRLYNLRPDKTHRTLPFLIYDIRANIPVELKNAISAAFLDWEPYIPLKFIPLDPGPGSIQPDIIAEFFKGEHGDGQPFDGPHKILAHASVGSGSILHFDAEEKWQTGALSADGMDMGTVARHEIGHLLGLEHSDDENALMYPYSPLGAVKEIGDDDKAGIKALYYG